jgi:hypothetical protein
MPPLSSALALILHSLFLSLSPCAGLCNFYKSSSTSMQNNVVDRNDGGVIYGGKYTNDAYAMVVDGVYILRWKGSESATVGQRDIMGRYYEENGYVYEWAGSEAATIANKWFMFRVVPREESFGSGPATAYVVYDNLYQSDSQSTVGRCDVCGGIDCAALAGVVVDQKW